MAPPWVRDGLRRHVETLRETIDGNGTTLACKSQNLLLSEVENIHVSSRADGCRKTM